MMRLATTLAMRAVGGQVYNTAMAHAALGDDVVGEFLHLHRCLRDGGEASYHHKRLFRRRLRGRQGLDAEQIGRIHDRIVATHGIVLFVHIFEFWDP